MKHTYFENLLEKKRTEGMKGTLIYSVVLHFVLYLMIVYTLPLFEKKITPAPKAFTVSLTTLPGKSARQGKPAKKQGEPVSKTVPEVPKTESVTPMPVSQKEITAKPSIPSAPLSKIPLPVSEKGLPEPDSEPVKTPAKKEKLSSWLKENLSSLNVPETMQVPQKNNPGKTVQNSQPEEVSASFKKNMDINEGNSGIDNDGEDSESGGDGSFKAVTEGNFFHPYYLSSIENKISSKWRPPPVPFSKGINVTVHFVIRKDGKIASADIERGSGNEFYDQAALSAVWLANPFPPLPPEFNWKELGVHFNFNFGGNF